jgi:uncharacterized protein involved in cysteine biosynthesis
LVRGSDGPIVPGGRDPGLARGFGAPFRGFGVLLRRPSLWPLASVPVVLFAGLGVGGAHLAGLAWSRVEVAVSRAWGHGVLASVGAAVAQLLVAVAILCAVVIVAAIVVPPLAAPFMDSLAARVDRRKGLDESLLHQVVRAIRVALAGLVFVGLPQLAIWVLAIAAPVLAPVWGGLGVAIASFGLAFDALDWPLARRGLGVRARLRWMREHPAATTGLGLAVWMLSLVPGLSIAALPAIVVGAVGVVNDAEPGA